MNCKQTAKKNEIVLERKTINWNLKQLFLIIKKEKMNFKTFLCRCCLFVLKEKKIFNIFETEDLAKKLMLCSTLSVEVMDEYPINVCMECYEQVQRFYEFQQMCCKSLEKYNELINSEEENGKSSEDHIKEITTEEDNNITDEDVFEEITKKKKSGRPHKKKLEICKNENQPHIEQFLQNTEPATLNSGGEIECKTIEACNTPNNLLRKAKGSGSFEDNSESKKEEHILTKLNYLIIEEKVRCEELFHTENLLRSLSTYIYIIRFYNLNGDLECFIYLLLSFFKEHLIVSLFLCFVSVLLV